MSLAVNSGRVRRSVAALAITGVMAVVPVVLTSQPAGAWTWSSTVTLTGQAKFLCMNGIVLCAPQPSIVAVYVSATDGESGWAAIWGSGHFRSYSRTLNNVGGGKGTWVTVTVFAANGARFAKSFGVARPTTGQNAVVDVCNFSPGC